MKQKCSYIGCKEEVIGYFVSDNLGLWLCRIHRMGTLQTPVGEIKACPIDHKDFYKKPTEKPKKKSFGDEMKKTFKNFGTATDKVLKSLDNKSMRDLDAKLKKVAGDF